jgi:RNA polymerase sigma-70 factor (ECF subfamily)
MRAVGDDSIPTRPSLLGRLRDWDDRESWQDFYNTYWKLIYGVARKAGLTEAEAEDVTQETIVTVAKKMEDFRYDPALGSFKGWLLHTTRWRIGDCLRKRLPGGRPAGGGADDALPTRTVQQVPDPASLDLGALWEKDWRANLLDAALERVKRRVNAVDFQIYDLTAIKGWSVAEARRTLGVSAYRVYNARSRVARKLRAELKWLETKLF